MVFYRKYRPQKIEDLDNKEVRQSLYSLLTNFSFEPDPRLSSKRTPSLRSSVHAFLFTGPKGLGKTSSARIVAKVINCEKHLPRGKAGKNIKGKLNEKEIEPDNKCSQCVSITNGNNLDVLEIDGASNRGIDEIRDLKEKINLAPFKAFRKIYIIDEVHMLTTEAFNALLKTLEEPPNHAVFILCTTEPQKVPATIASRCFRVNFTRATSEELVRSLLRIVKAEDIKIENPALLEIAKLSDGSFRDASKILEEVLNFAGRKNITADLVNEKYNMLGIGQSVSEMLEALAKKDMKKGFLICQNLVKQGMDFKYFIEQLVERLHLMLLIKVGAEQAPSTFKGETFESLSVGDIKKLFELLSESYQDTKFAVLPQAPLELAVLEWTEGGNEAGSLLHAESDAQQVLSNQTQSQALLSVNRQLDKSGNSKPSMSISNSLSGGQSSGFFLNLINEVKNHNNLLAGVLRSCSAKEIKNGNLEIIARSKFHKEKLEEEKAIKILEEAAKNLSNKKINVKILLGGDNHE